MIITREMVARAITLARPTADAILLAADDGTTWDPKWVNCVVSAPGVDEAWFTFGMVTGWDPKWGDGPDFTGYARNKLETACRLGHDTGAIVALCPWQLRAGENLYPGGVYRLGIGCGVSGAMGRADEAIASVVVDMIIMLAHLETDRRVAAEEMVI